MIHAPLMWRLSNIMSKRLGLRSNSSDPGFVLWGRNIGCIGDGSVTMHGSFSIANNMHFQVSAPGSVQMRDRVRLDVGVILCAYSGTIDLHDRVYIGPYCYLQSESILTVGRNTMLGQHVQVLAYTRTMERGPVPYADQKLTSKGVTIGENVWIGAGATILDGVTIGDNSVVAAGAVVSRDVPPATLVAGVPARIMRNIV
jgi:acetyltransferase-like isoleucine patch superfamily enzyme